MAIRWDKFTIKSQEAFQHASDLASQHGNPELLPVHMLVVLARDREGIVVPVLSKLGANPTVIEAQAMERVEALPKVSGSGATQAHLSSEMQKVLASEELKERFVALGMDPISSTPDDMAAFMRREQERYGNIIRTANIKVEQ